MFLYAENITMTEDSDLINRGVETLQIHMQTKRSTAERSGMAEKALLWMICFAVMLLIILSSTGAAMAKTTTGTVATTALNLRSGPGSNYISLGLLSINKQVTILDEIYDTAGEKWYYVISPAGTEGYVSAKYIEVNSDAEYVTDESFESYLNSQGFPESYKPYLRELHARYPQWVFKAADTGLDWDSVIQAESKVGTSLVASSSPSSWKSMEPGAYDFTTGKYIEYDSGGWVCASKGIVAYYMDPRNFINPVGIFQFLTHSFDSSTQTKEGLQNVIKNTFMSGTFPEPTHETYADVLMEAGKTAGVNPYVLASMIILEQGSSGKGGCISGTVAGYEGYYNFFNIGAYKSGTMSAVTRGVWYASQSGSYGRPWDSRYKSIIGGAQFYGSQYVQQNKNTLYFKKFNVMNGQDSVGKGQYMTNIQGAEGEAAALRNGYADALSDPMTFLIPVYRNMPNETVSMPSSGSNNNYLSKLEAEGFNLTPEFDRYTSQYELVVSKDTKYITVNAKTSSSSASAAGTGKVTLSSDTTEVRVTVTAASGEVRVYTITVSKSQNGQQNQNETGISSSKYTFDDFVRGVGEKTSYEAFANNIKVTNGKLDVMNSSGKVISSGTIATGMKVVLYDSQGETVCEYSIAVTGDTNGDGKINSADALAIQKHIVESRELKNAYLDAADINRDGRVNSLDVLYVQKHIVGSYTIADQA